MGKPNGHDVTIKQSNGRLIITTGSTSKPSNGNIICRLDLNTVKAELEVHDMNDSLNLIKIETGSANANNPHVKVEPTLRRHEPASRLSLRGSNKKNKTCKKRDSKVRSQHEPANRGSAAKSESGHEPELILMSCLNCYMHVMVCDVNPKCPKCHKGDCLLDMYRG